MSEDQSDNDQLEQPEFDPNMPAGVPEGTELDTDNGVEVVVHDYQLNEKGKKVKDEDGNPIVIGWHKEVKDKA